MNVNIFLAILSPTYFRSGSTCQKPYTKIPQRKGAQEGYVLFVGALLTLALALIYGLALDLARHFQAKSRLQNASDSGAIAGSRFISTPEAANAKFKAEALTQANLVAQGYDLSQVNLGINFLDSNNTELSVKADFKQRNILLDVNPFLPESVNIQAMGVASTKMSVTCIALDNSGSMKGKKIRDAKAAVLDFFKIFEPGADWLGVVSFNNSADVEVPMTSNFNIPSNLNNLSSIQAGGYTNTDHALRRCLNQMASVPLKTLQGAVRSIILVTDGAPTVSCVPDVNPTSPLDQISGNAAGAGCNYEATFIRETHYDRAIKVADHARTSLGGIQIFTLGIGQAPTTAFTDPYQGVRFSNPVKTYFLNRVALSSLDNWQEPDDWFDCSSEIVRFAAYSDNGLIDCNTPVRRTEEEAERSSNLYGNFFQTSDSGELSGILTTIGVSIRGRLID